jgi:hypothetical protein
MPETGQAGGLSDELEPYVDRAEAEAFDRMGELLRAQQPTPTSGMLARVAAGPQSQAPADLRLRVALALVAGLVLLGLAALGAFGSGPLGG